ncbi:MAG: hypothetical protein AB2L14_29285 [Candidatus Xenobiia bacterium LiM19]
MRGFREAEIVDSLLDREYGLPPVIQWDGDAIRANFRTCDR